MKPLVKDKGAVVMGVANSRSLASFIAHKLYIEEARLAISYLADEKGRAKRRVEEACEKFPPSFLSPCNLNKEEEVRAFFEEAASSLGSLDFLVHAVAFAPLEDIRAETLMVSRDGFLQAMESSVYSLIASVREASKYMKKGSSIVTLSYFGAEKVVPGYNLMGLCKSALESAVRYLAHELGPRGIRINAVSAGALKTLASSAIPHFSSMLEAQEKISPLGGKLLPEDVAETVLFLLSDGARAITGEVLHVDGGYNIMGTLEPASKREKEF